MSLRINHNIASINGHRNMLQNDAAISKSLEKLSSGLRINRAADDAAGLVISEQMRAQITGLDQAIDNSETAVSMVQTAEGALDEVNSLLNKARELVLHAQNEGANDTAQLEADQAELDNVIQSISRIGDFTQFGTKKLLDGSLNGVNGASSGIDYIKAGNLNENLAAGQVSLAVSSSTREARTLASGSTTDTNSRVFDSVVTGVNIGSASLNSGASFSVTIDGVTFNHSATGAMSGQAIADKINSGGLSVNGESYTASFDGTNIQIASDRIDDFQDFTAAVEFSVGANAGTAEAVTTRLESPSGGNAAAGEIFVGQGNLSGATTSTEVATDTIYSVNLTTVTGGSATINVSGSAGTGTASTFSGGSTLGDVFGKLEALIDNEVGFTGGVTLSTQAGTGAEQLRVTLTRDDDSQVSDFNFSLSIDHNNSSAATTHEESFDLATITGNLASGDSTFLTAANTGGDNNATGGGTTLGDNVALRLVVDGNELLVTGGVTLTAAATSFQTSVQALGGQYDDATVTISGTNLVMQDADGESFSFALSVDESDGVTDTFASATSQPGSEAGLTLDVSSVTGSAVRVQGTGTEAAVTLNNNTGATVEQDGAAGTAVATTSTGGTINMVQTYVADSGEATFTLTTGAQDAGFSDVEVGFSASFATTGGNATFNLDGGANFQVGANENQSVSVGLAEVSATALGRTASEQLLNMNDMLSTEKGALLNIATYGDEALSVIDKAIDEVTVLRGDLGAFQANTLESGLNSLRVSQENLTAAESTIRDVDFAAESAQFTRNNILIQASTSMLAQANQLPQNVLQLLG